MSEQPMRKTEARLAERERARAQQRRTSTMQKVIPLIIGVAVVLFIVLVAVTTVNQTTLGTIGARLQVDQEKIDLGNRIFNQPVRAAFTVKNVGDGTLKLETPKVANVLEGC